MNRSGSSCCRCLALGLLNLIVGALPGIAAEGQRMRVTADRVNLRAAAGDHFEVVGQVSTDRELLAVGEWDQEWIQVVPPPEIDLWVYADLVDNGKIIVNRAQIRAGAGLNYQIVGRLERGAELSVRGHFGDWLRIAPPPGSALWVSRDYVQPFTPSPPPRSTDAEARPSREPPRVEDATPPPPPPPSPPVPPSPPSTPAAPPSTPSPSAPLHPPAAALPPPPRQPPAVRVPPTALPESAFPRAGERPATVKPSETPHSLSRFALIQEQTQGAPGRFTGVLRRSGWIFRRPSRYRLVIYDRSGRAVTQCFIVEREAQLKQLVGERIELEGRVYWISGLGYPTVAVDRLVRLE